MAGEIFMSRRVWSRTMEFLFVGAEDIAEDLFTRKRTMNYNWDSPLPPGDVNGEICSLSGDKCS